MLLIKNYTKLTIKYHLIIYSVRLYVTHISKSQYHHTQYANLGELAANIGYT